MFINCPYCRALVATDLATDLPPVRCPQCQGPLRETEDTNNGDDTQAADAQRHATDIDNAAFDEITTAEVFGDDEIDDRAMIERGESGEIAEAASPTETEIEITSTVHDAAFVSIDADTPLTQDGEGETTAVIAQPSNRAPARRRAGQITPSFARAQSSDAGAARTLSWPTIAAIIGLSTLFVLQMLLADRARLATNERWRPLLETLCGALACDLPPWREPAAFELLQRDVRQHPTVPGALRVSASFRNDARWPQPWPRLRLTLSDVNGRTAGERRFEAREYLGGAPAQAELASGETATVAMDILEPAAHIVAYDFSFD